MDTLEEALLAASGNEYEPEYYFDINNDFRTISIPSSKRLAGVYNDKDVNTIYFRIPRYYGPLDLFDFDFRINYINPEGNGDIYYSLDKSLSGNYIIFSWTLARFAFPRSGIVNFSVCARILDEFENVVKEFNTAIHQLNVINGLEIDGSSIIENYPGVIAELLSSIRSSYNEETVSGSTVTINGIANTLYICGELSSLTINAPINGMIDVIFESGDTPTVLTLSDNITMPDHWAGVEANTKYEMNFLNGVGVYSEWQI